MTRSSVFLTLLLSSTAFSQVCISFLGDCTIGCDVRVPEFDRYVSANGYAYFFSRVKSVLDADDYTVANLETAIIDSGTPREKQFRFRGKPDYLAILKEGSVECVTLANNHSWDYGDSGYAQTKRHLTARGIDYFAYENVLRKEIKGLNFAFIGQSFYIQAPVIPLIKSIRDSVDFIVVVLHWGNEREYTPNKNQKQIGRSLIDAGADLVVGHHPHVLQPVENYKNKYIAYSLGNFVFGGNRNPKDKRTMIFQAYFQKFKPISIKQIPCKISSVDTVNNFQPVILTEPDSN